MNHRYTNSNITEGYVFTSYGKLKYLRHVVAAVDSIRRFDLKRPVALYCCREHRDILVKNRLQTLFNFIEILPSENRSIVGFKHNVHKFMPFDRNMYLDSDIIWCRDPDHLWKKFGLYPYITTGQESADVFFGTHKGVWIVFDILLGRRQRTLKRFGFTHLYRVQSGIIFAQNYDVARQVNDMASGYLTNKNSTHFLSRTNEKGRTLESCEWSLGMALSKLNMFVYPWFNGYESVQLDYISEFTRHDEEFRRVECLYYCNPFIYSLRGLKSKFIRKLLMGAFSILPRSKDHFWVTPYMIHFGWKHEKSRFETYSERKWEELAARAIAGKAESYG